MSTSSTAAAPAAGGGQPHPRASAPRGVRGTGARPPEARISVAIGFAMLSVLLFSFVASLFVVTPVQYAAQQHRLYSDLRLALAQGSAPVGPTMVDAAAEAKAKEERNRRRGSYSAMHGKRAKKQMPVPVGTPLLLLEIPVIGVKDVVVEGTGSHETAYALGHKRDTALPGQQGVSVIMGRSGAFGAPFKGLSRLSPGSEIKATTGEGVFTYKVTGVRWEGDPLPPPLAAGASRLTLTTAGGPTYRPDNVVRVDALLVGPAKPRPTPLCTNADLAESEQAMGRETSSLLPLVFLLQLGLAVVLLSMWSWHRWGRLQTYLVATPVLVTIGVFAATQIAYLLPNLL